LLSLIIFVMLSDVKPYNLTWPDDPSPACSRILAACSRDVVLTSGKWSGVHWNNRGCLEQPFVT